MSKRLHDTECWSKQWFRHLPVNSKLLWFYILDSCDTAGIWEIDFEQASFFAGTPFEPSNLNDLEKQFKRIDDKRIIVLDFIDFQYGNLHTGHKMQNKVFSELAKFDLKYPINRVSVNLDRGKDKDIYSSSSSDINLNKDSLLDYKNVPRVRGDEPTWRTDYKIYQKECSDAFDLYMADWDWIAQKRRYYPGVNIRESLHKMWAEYWETEAGWIKKKESRCKKINWLRTIENGLSMKQNKVWIPKGGPDEEATILAMKERENGKKNQPAVD